MNKSFGDSILNGPYDWSNGPWQGQIEAKDTDAPYKLLEKSSNRYKVRIVGRHRLFGECKVPTEDLPWAHCTLPVTSPYSDGGTTGAVPKLENGSWVTGIYLNGDRNKPVILASIGHTAGATVERQEDPNPGEPEKNLTTFTSPKTNPHSDLPDNYEADGGSTGQTKVGERGAVADSSATSITSQVKSFYGTNSGTNPAGYNFCVSIADPTCGAENDVKGEFSRILGEMLAANQSANGQIGDYLVGQAMGEIYDIQDTARKYINKMIRVMKTFWSRVKGEIVKKIREGVDKLTKAILRPDESGNALTPVTQWFNNILDDLGCSMADLGDRFGQWLTDLLFGYLYDLYKNAACQVDILVNGIVAEIQSLLNDLLGNILGPIQDILGAIASPLNLIGGAINSIFKLLGISCDGPSSKCQKKKTVCTDCATEKKEDFLDKLLKDLADGPREPNYVCSDAVAGIKKKPTVVTFVGGSYDNEKKVVYTINDIKVSEGSIAKFTVGRTGYTSIESSVKYKTVDGSAVAGEDFEIGDGIVGFSQGETEKTIEIQTLSDEDLEGKEEFFVILAPNTPLKGSSIGTIFEKNVGTCVIVEGDINPTQPLDESDLENLEIPENLDTGISADTTKSPNSVISDITIDYPVPTTIGDSDGGDTGIVTGTGDSKQYAVKAYVNGDRTANPKTPLAEEGDYILYVISTQNIEEGTELGWRIFGKNITPSDILGGVMNGTVVINNAKAFLTVGIEEDTEIENTESLTFALTGTGATATVLIKGDDIGDLVPDVVDPYQPPQPPTVDDPLVNPDGEIVELPIGEPGDPYVEPPTVFITGDGYGAKGLALLDRNGRVSEIRILSKGIGYSGNTPEEQGLQCIIDSFTLLRPGRGYKSAPKVYVNGELDVAEAIINDDGFVVSVRVLDRFKKFTSMPKVDIIGGGGFGARYMPSLACLDNNAIDRLGVAKIGTGRYIDCP